MTIEHDAYLIGYFALADLPIEQQWIGRPFADTASAIADGDLLAQSAFERLRPLVLVLPDNAERDFALQTYDLAVVAWVQEVLDGAPPQVSALRWLLASRDSALRATTFERDIAPITATHRRRGLTP